MPELAPFRGLMFNPAKVTLATALAPMTGLVDGPARARLHDAPANVVRLVAAGTDADRAAATEQLEEWRAKEIVVRDPAARSTASSRPRRRRPACDRRCAAA